MKFDHYRQLASLQEYVLIAQDRRHIERYLRQAGVDGWLFRAVTDPKESVHLTSLGCELALAEVYDRVRIAPSEDRLCPPGRRV